MLSAVIVAGGTGERLGGEPKVWRLVEGKPLWWWSLNAFTAVAGEQILVVAADRRIEAERVLEAWGASPRPRVTVGGTTRQASSQSGVAAISGEYCAIHDAARPLVTPELIRRVYQAAQRTGAALPALVPSDTVKVVDRAGQVEATLPRDRLRLVQTPQIFRTEWLREAWAGRSATPVTDDAQLIEQLGYPIQTVTGDADNMKVTVPGDWERFLALWAARRGEETP